MTISYCDQNLNKCLVQSLCAFKSNETVNIKCQRDCIYLYDLVLGNSMCVYCKCTVKCRNADTDVVQCTLNATVAVECIRDIGKPTSDTEDVFEFGPTSLTITRKYNGSSQKCCTISYLSINSSSDSIVDDAEQNFNTSWTHQVELDYTKVHDIFANHKKNSKKPDLFILLNNDSLILKSEDELTQRKHFVQPNNINGSGALEVCLVHSVVSVLCDVMKFCKTSPCDENIFFSFGNDMPVFFQYVDTNLIVKAFMGTKILDEP